jgi:hypothetical protein
MAAERIPGDFLLGDPAKRAKSGARCAIWRILGAGRAPGGRSSAASAIWRKWHAEKRSNGAGFRSNGADSGATVLDSGAAVLDSGAMALDSGATARPADHRSFIAPFLLKGQAGIANVNIRSASIRA